MRQAASMIIDTNFRQELIAYLIEFAKASMISLTIVPVSVPKAKHIPDNLQGVHHLIANHDELYAIAYQHAVPEIDNESNPASLLAACQIIAQRGCQEVIITSGAKGVFAYDAATQTFSHVPAQKATIIDVTGAGDAFAAAYSFARFHGEKMLCAIRFATEIATMTLATHETVSSRLTPDLAREFLMNCKKPIQEER
jgi:pseudouridine kinase